MSSTSDLAALLQRLRLQPPHAGSPSDAVQAQIDLLLDRVATLTGALRGADGHDVSHVAARVLLADLAMVAAHLRGHASAHGASLARVLDSVREILDRTGETATPV
jgi:hypothetical protein